MKRNGFISTAMAYTFLIIFAFILLSIIRSYNNSITYSNEIKDSAKNELMVEYTYFKVKDDGEGDGCTEFTLEKDKTYTIELWGADGNNNDEGDVFYHGGQGAYIKISDVKLPENSNSDINTGSEDKTINICVGKKGTSSVGGGATYIKYGTNIVVAAAGGGNATYDSNGNDAEEDENSNYSCEYEYINGKTNVDGGSNCIDYSLLHSIGINEDSTDTYFTKNRNPSKSIIPIPVYEPGSNSTYGNGSARIYKSGGTN